MILVDIVLCFSAILNFSSGKRGVKCSKETRSLTTLGSRPLILSTLINGKYFSPSFGGRTVPNTVSPVLIQIIEFGIVRHIHRLERIGS